MITNSSTSNVATLLWDAVTQCVFFNLAYPVNNKLTSVNKIPTTLPSISINNLMAFIL